MIEVTDKPLDQPKPVADNVWVVDSVHRLAGAPLPVRMTVLRLPDGTLLLHSPTRHCAQTRAALEELGPIAHLVAPNMAHFSYLAAWQQHVPGATFWAVPGLRKRKPVIRAALRLDRDLPADSHQAWGGAVDCILIPGLGMVEAALFHRPSRTLVLTDLVVNVEPARLPGPLALGARLAGSAAPHGKAPFYLRLAFRLGGDKARRAARHLLELEPDRVIFAHGQWFQTDSQRQLRQALDWLI